MKLRHAAALALVLLSSACTTKSDMMSNWVGNPNAMNSWVGSPEPELLASWGAPDVTATLPDGGKADTWMTNWTNGAGLHICRKIFTLDAEGEVTKWSYNDCRCSPGATPSACF